MKIYNNMTHYYTTDIRSYLGPSESYVSQGVSEDLHRGYIKPEHFHEYAIFFKEYCAKPHYSGAEDTVMQKAWGCFPAELPLLVYTRPTNDEEGAVWNTLKADEKRNFITIDEATKEKFYFAIHPKVALTFCSQYGANGNRFYPHTDSGEKAYRAHSVIYAKTLIRWLTLYHAAVADFLCGIRQAMTAVGCENINVPSYVSELFSRMDAAESFVECNIKGLTEHSFTGLYFLAKNITVVGTKEDMLALDVMLKKVGLTQNYQRRIILAEAIENEVAEAQLLGLFTGEGTEVPKYGSLMPIAWECAMGYVFPYTTHGTAMFNHMHFVPMGQTQAAQAKFKQVSKKLVIFGAANPSVGILVTSAGFIQVDDLDDPQTFELMSPETLAVMLGLKTFEQFSLERSAKGYPTVQEWKDRYVRITALYEVMRQYYFNNYVSAKYHLFDVNAEHEFIQASVDSLPLQDVSPQVFAGLPFKFNTKKCWRGSEGFSIKNLSFVNYVAYLMDIIHSLMSCNDLRFYQDEKLSSAKKYSSFDEYIKEALNQKRALLCWTVFSDKLKAKDIDCIPQNAIDRVVDDKYYTIHTPIGVGDTYDNWEIPVLKQKEK